MEVSLNSSQRKALSSFFNNVAVAWFVGAFVTPQITPEFGPLTILRYLGNMIITLYFAMFLLKEET